MFRRSGYGFADKKFADKNMCRLRILEHVPIPEVRDMLLALATGALPRMGLARAIVD